MARFNVSLGNAPWATWGSPFRGIKSIVGILLIPKAAESSLSLLKVNEGVKFSENTDKVYLLFCLAAKDSSSHIEIIEKLADILGDEEKIEKLITSKTIGELKNNL